MKKQKRILIFNVNWLGDVLFSTATIRNIRRNFPGSFIACVVPSRCYQLLKGNPHLDEVIIFDERDRHRGIFAKLSFIRQLRRRRFDIVFLLHRSFTRAFICWLAGIPERVGYIAKNRGFLLTKKFKAPDATSMHRIDYYLTIIEKAGLKVEDRYTEFFTRQEDAEFVESFLNKRGVAKSDFLVVLNPGGNWRYKRWPKEYWAELAEKLLQRKNTKVVITGGISDIQLAQEIRELMSIKPIIACGLMGLKQLGALCKRAQVFVTADSGPLHVANAVSAKKIIALFGPTSDRVTGPFPMTTVTILQKDVSCIIPCYTKHCSKDNACMKAILPSEVEELIVKNG